MLQDQLCQRCEIRPAVAAVRRVRNGMPPVVERLCARCLQEGRLAHPGARRGGLLDEFMAAMFPGFGSAPGGAMPGRAGPTGEVGPTGEMGDTGEPGPAPGRPQQVDITRFFSDATREVLRQAAGQAMEWGSLEIDTDHLLWAATRDPAAVALLRRVDVSPDTLRSEVEQAAEPQPRTDVAPSLSPDAKRVLLGAFEESRRLGASYLGPDHVLMGLARDPDSAAGQVLARHGLDVARLRHAAAQGPSPEEAAAAARSDTPTLDQHSSDLTARAREGKLDPVIGRDMEIEQTIEVLSRRTKNNPVLIGDPGVGKTAIAEGIAQRIVTGDVPDTLAGKRLVALDLGGLLAGTRYRGEFEQRLKGVIDEVTAHSDELILFIDEIHTLVGAGAAEGAMDAANMLKPGLARGDLHVIGATTLDEYRKNVEQDAALERRLQPIVVGELDVEETIRVLFGLKDRYEAFHRVRITDEAVDAAARLADRYIADRFLPDKAIDLIDQASARVRLRHHGQPEDTQSLRDEIERLKREKDQAVGAEDYERAAELRTRLDDLERQVEEATHGRHPTVDVTAEDVAEVVARATGIPVAQLTQAERDRLMNLEKQLHQHVVNQEEAVRVVSEAIRRNRAGLGDPNRPVGSFLFLGPTGVGKTELARALARTLFGSDDLLVRFDMSEFQERHTVSRLVGAPPGYVGYEEAGQLTEQVRRRPYSVVLLDEFEKAHPDVFNILLQVLDDGRLTDAQGRTVDFKNTIVIMTSNFGAERLLTPQAIGFRPGGDGDEGLDFDRARDDLLASLRREFRPEFLNRLDETVVFRPLTRTQLHEITRMLIDRLADRLRARRIHLTVTEPAVAHLAAEGYDPTFGARPLQRTIQRQVDNELSNRILAGEIDEDDRVTVDAEDGTLRITVDKAADGERLDDWEEPTPERRPPAHGPAAPRD